MVTDEWNNSSPELLWELFDEKMKQNPQLLQRLIQTAPLQLIEASTSRRWGGGAPSIPNYMTMARSLYLAKPQQDIEIRKSRNERLKIKRNNSSLKFGSLTWV